MDFALKRSKLALFILLAWGGGIAPLLGQGHIFDGPALSFTNLELGYERRYFDADRLEDGDGLHAGFSLAPIPLLYFTGDFNYASAEDFLSGDDVDFVDASLGLGLRLNILDTVALYAEGGAAYGQLNRPGGYDGSGYYLEPGIKLGLFGRVEASVAAEFTHLDGEAFFGAKAGLMIGLTDHLGITVDGGVSEHTDYVGVGLRIAW